MDLLVAKRTLGIARLAGAHLVARRVFDMYTKTLYIHLCEYSLQQYMGIRQMP